MTEFSKFNNLSNLEKFHNLEKLVNTFSVQVTRKINKMIE